MATNIYMGSTVAVAQIDTATPANVVIDDVFTLTLTDDLDNTAAVSFTATAATVANVTAGLTAAWNASTDPLLTGITASDSTTHVTLTADTAGVPFSVAATCTGSAHNEVQELIITGGTPESGKFSLNYAGQDTGNTLDYNATAAEVDTALEALSNIGAGDVACAFGPMPGTAITITFTGALAGTDVALITGGAGTLDAGSPSISESTKGSPADTHTRAASTASKGPNDYGVADNWSLGAIPVATNDVIIPAGASAILYGLNQSAVQLASFTQEEGHANAIGRWAQGGHTAMTLYPLRIDIADGTTPLILRGSGSLAAFDLGTAAVPVVSEHTGSPSATGRNAVYVKGSAITTVQNRSGTTGVADHPGDTATVSTGFDVTAGVLTVGSGCTVSGTTLRMHGGTVYAYASIPTIHVDDGSFYQEAGTWTTAYVRGTVYTNGVTTYATTTLYPSGVLDNRGNLAAKTLTNLTMYDGASLYDPSGRITFTNAIAFTTGMASCTLELGKARKFAPADI